MKASGANVCVFNCPFCLFTLGEAYEGLGQEEKAVRLFQLFLEQAKASDPFRATALKRIDQLSSQER